ncbi:carboxylesterase family protein [Streptomyces europaeiscabiei]|uniref:carboxylesterase family protein n=1 Tax=Streptomyces europaeiscabiei TaxID=146819 RepID=UPI002E1515FF|nr:carboxylesterase family protein [Streptomyces europaeiscabiei]
MQTTAGPLRGQATFEGRQFLGVPYAADPVGALRWRPPQPHPAWEGVRDATEFGPRCLQGTNPQQGTYTENCLNLNVYTPASPRRLPVMVWIHGGGMIHGSGKDYVADRFAADGNVIVVTINYRLGASGFHPARCPGQLRPARPAGGPVPDTRQHRLLRRRPARGHHRR